MRRSKRILGLAVLPLVLGAFVASAQAQEGGKSSSDPQEMEIPTAPVFLGGNVADTPEAKVVPKERWFVPPAGPGGNAAGGTRKA
jgi:hypothetical protein